MLTFDADGAEYDELVAAIDAAKKANNHEDKAMAAWRVQHAFAEYINKASGGLAEDITNVFTVFWVYDKVIPMMATGQ